MQSMLSKYYNYIFLIVIVFYNLFPKKARPCFLLASSILFFYLLSGWRVLFILLTIVSIYISTVYMDKIDTKKKLVLEETKDDDKKLIKESFKRKKRLVLILCLLFNIAFLFIFKYLKFFTINLNYILDLFKLGNFSIMRFIAPIGISFYTLGALSYLFDVYNGKIKADKNFLKVALYMAFFPCIMEGPICRFPDTAEDLFKGSKITYHNLCFGLQRILWGLFKKMVIADRINIVVKTIFEGYINYQGPVIFLGALSYTIMLYMDFSSAMDVVCGIGNIFGVNIPENFKQPFFSKNISEFWTRWHISLGAWFKDYIYYPISLSKPMKKMTLKLRKILGNHYGPLLSGTVALFVVWFLNGLWHGAGWTYILFGLYHFIMISIGNITRTPLSKLYVKLNIASSKLLKLCQIIKTTFLVILGELIFRANSVSSALAMLKKIFTSFRINKGELCSLGIDLPDVMVLIIALFIVLIINLYREKGISVRSKLEEKNIVIRWFIYYALIFAIIIFGAFGPGYAPVDPIYADF